MSLPDLCLLPHEAGDLAPDEPLCAPATARFFLKGGYLMRPYISTEGEKKMAVRKEAEGAPLLKFWSELSAATFESEMKQYQFHRTLYFDADCRLLSSRTPWQFCLATGGSDGMNWMLPNGEFAHFFWQSTRNPLQVFQEHWDSLKSDAWIEREILEQLNDPDSDCSFAWSWVQLSPQERHIALFEIDNEALEKCRGLLRAALWSDSELKINGFLRWRIRLLHDNSLLVKPRIHEMLNRSCMEDQFALYHLSSRQSRLLQLIIENFGLHHANKFRQRYFSSVMSLHRDSKENWEVDVYAPTMHQILEARLNLRDFLRDKVSPAELAELMPA